MSTEIPRLYHRLEGTAASVGVLRRALRRWLAGVVDDRDVVDDLTLAAGEALENSADHAFVGLPRCGTITLTAEVEHRAGIRDVVIAVVDDGCWQPPAADPGHRGRGLAMIAGLADTHRLIAGRSGTSLTLRHSY